MTETASIADPKGFLRDLFDTAVDAVRAEACVPGHLPRPYHTGRLIVVGAGKAAAAMASVVEEHWPERVYGQVVTAHGHGVKCKRLKVIEAGHPRPDGKSTRAAAQILGGVTRATAADLVLCLFSGGGSSALTLPAPGIEFDDKRRVTDALLLSGAAINEINCVRKHISDIKGGRLAQAIRPARMHTLIISDVPGDDPATVASGPTVADPTTLGDARAVLEKYRIDPPDAVAQHLAAAENETPKPGDAAFTGAQVEVIARARDALEAAAARARALGIEPVILGDDIEGEAREVALDHAALAMRRAGEMGPGSAPLVLLSGGETTVALNSQENISQRPSGRGGRNTEYLLALAAALKGDPRIWALACDSDGIDGSGDAAGAIIAPDSLERAEASGCDAPAMLDGHDSYRFFDTLGDLVITGPTRTNVNDFRAILIGAGAAQRIDL